MQKYIAFISGLQMGGGDVETEKVRTLLERLGFLNVETFRARDNVVFDSAPVGVIGPLEAQISRHLKRSLQLEHVWTFIRTPDQLAKLVKNIPFTEEQLADEDNVSFVVMLSEELDPRAERQLRIRRTETDTLVPDGKHIYWLRHESPDAGPPPLLSEIIDVPATVRSLQTLSRLARTYSGDQARPQTERPNGHSEETSQSEQSRQ